MENYPIEVSIIIPNYNYARFLQQRIESVLAQTYTDYEIILLDDASTDDSVSILNHYKTNSRVAHLEINSVNTGSPFAQWQKGISLSRGKYIWIAESDDAADSSFLEKAVSILNQYPHASFCFLGSTLRSFFSGFTFSLRVDLLLEGRSTFWVDRVDDRSSCARRSL